MKELLSLFRPKLLGVDLGSRTVKGVKLSSRGGRVRLAAHFFQDLSEGALAPGENALDTAFQAALEVSELTTTPAITAVRDTDVGTLRFTVPKMKTAEIRSAVAHELEESSGVAMTELNYDFRVLAEDPAKPESLEIKAYFTKKEIVTERMKPFQKAGLSCRAIETELMAIVEMLDFNGYLAADQVQLAIDFGESHVALGLVSDGELKLTRHIAIGTGSIVAALQEKLGLSAAEAEKRRAEYSFSAEIPGSGPGAEAAVVIDDALTAIFREIKEGIDFFRECPESYGRIDRILLAGGGSQIRDIDKVHDLFFKAPSAVVNPFKNIDIFSGPDEAQNEEIARLAPFMSVAVGLALASIEEREAA